jgi:hypothetical protein
VPALRHLFRSAQAYQNESVGGYGDNAAASRLRHWPWVGWGTMNAGGVPCSTTGVQCHVLCGLLLLVEGSCGWERGVGMGRGVQFVGKSGMSPHTSAA